MNLIVISPSENLRFEQKTTLALFEQGLSNLHIYKPSFNKEEIQQYISSYPEKYHKYIVQHSQFPKFHSIEELENYTGEYEYAFLSPIFDSISKKGYKSSFDLREVKRKLSLADKRIIALGGIDEDKIEVVRELGFAGVAVLGAIWESNNPVEKFVRLKTLCQQ